MARVTMPVPNSPHLYRRVINVEPPPEREEDFESPGMTKPPVPRFTSKFEAGRYTSGVEAFLVEKAERSIHDEPDQRRCGRISPGLGADTAVRRPEVGREKARTNTPAQSGAITITGENQECGQDSGQSYIIHNT